MNRAERASSTGDQQRALWLSTISFTVCFAVWTIFSIIGIQIKKDLGARLRPGYHLCQRAQDRRDACRREHDHDGERHHQRAGLIHPAPW